MDKLDGLDNVFFQRLVWRSCTISSCVAKLQFRSQPIRPLARPLAIIFVAVDVLEMLKVLRVLGLLIVVVMIVVKVGIDVRIGMIY